MRTSLFVLFALDASCMFLVIPLFTTYINSLGGSPFVQGVINSSTAFISLFFNPIVGSLSDSKGRRNILSRCLLAGMISNLILSLANSLTIVYIGKIIGGFASPINVLLRVVAADMIKSDDEKKIFFNKVMLIGGLVMLFSGGLSGFISEHKGGCSLAFFLVSVIYAISTIIVNIALPNDSKQSTRRDEQNMSAFSIFLKEIYEAVSNLKQIQWSRYWDIFAAKAASESAMAIFVTNFGLFILREFGVEGRQSSYIFISVSIISMLSLTLKIKMKPYLDMKSDYEILMASSIIMAISFTIMSLAHNLYFVVVCIWGVIGAKSFIDATFTEVITTRTTDTDRGKVMSAFENLPLVAQFFANVFSGLLSLIISQRVMFGLAAIPTLIGTFISYEQFKQKIKDV